MDVQNETPFPCVAWETADANKTEYLTTLLRVKYVFHKTKKAGEWQLRLTPKQDELFAEDTYYNDDLNAPVQYESDYVAYKPNTDIILNARAKTQLAKEQWTCQVKVYDEKQQHLKTSQLTVQSPCQMNKHRLLGWVEGDREKTTDIVLGYDKAYGGTINNPDPETKEEKPFLAQHESNYVGTGITHKHMEERSYSSPQITWTDKAQQKTNTPAGFGFINRGWQPRISYAGTYDQQWLDDQHPYPPHDFDYYHYQAANPTLICDGYLHVGSQLELHNLLAADSIDTFTLPRLYCFTDIEDKAGEKIRKLMNIDTVIIDIEAKDPKNWSVYLSYRHFAPHKIHTKTVTLKYLPQEQLERQQAEQINQVSREFEDVNDA